MRRGASPEIFRLAKRLIPSSDRWDRASVLRARISEDRAWLDLPQHLVIFRRPWRGAHGLAISWANNASPIEPAIHDPTHHHPLASSHGAVVARGDGVA